MKRFIISVVMFVLGAASAAPAQNARPFTVDDLLKVRRVNDPQLSPDGRTIAFTRRTLHAGRQTESRSPSSLLATAPRRCGPSR
jgi:hypothetical protein